MSITCLEDLKNTRDSVIQDVDKKVTRDLERFVDGQVRARKQELGDDIALWKLCVLIIGAGAFKKDIQVRVSAELGPAAVAGLKSFFESHSKGELEKEAGKRLDAVMTSAFKEFPSSAGDIEISGIKRAYKIIGS